ncbi:MAG: peptidylprolyl isomerase [bacterium]
MKKNVFLLLFFSMILSACVSNQNRSVITEKNAPAGLGSYDENNDAQRIREFQYSQLEQSEQAQEAEQAAQPPAEQAPPAEEPPRPDEFNKNNLIDMTQYEFSNTAIIKTNFGEIKIKLNPESAPISVDNFKKYAVSGFYDNTVFHRVISGFMVQCGGFGQDKKEKETEASIKNEADNGLKNNRGTVAMARTMEINSATSQFFINLVDNDFLNYKDDNNYGYAVFGEVISGMDTVDKIAKIKVDNNGLYENWPTEEVIIESIVLKE